MNFMKDRFDNYRCFSSRIRTAAVRMTHQGKSGHVGSSLSMADILAVLYTKILKVDPKKPKWLNAIPKTTNRLFSIKCHPHCLRNLFPSLVMFEAVSSTD